MGKLLSTIQVDAFRRDGFLVVPDLVSADDCVALRERAMQLAEEHVPSPEQATVFTADGKPQHTSDDYFLTSGEKIRCFFEKDAFDESGRLRSQPHLSLNKLGHAMHDLDPVFDSFSRTPQLAAVASDIGMRDPLLLQSMYIFKQAHIGGEVTCHTDHTYLWTEPRSVVGFWFAIDDATRENGCMWAVPGGHRLPVRTRSRLNESRTATVTTCSTPSRIRSTISCASKPSAARLCCSTVPCRTCRRPTPATNRGTRTPSTRSTARQTISTTTGCSVPRSPCADSPATRPTMATLRFSFGTMGSGKSTLALQIHHNLSSRGLRGLLITKLDRDGAQVTSRLGVSSPAVDIGAAPSLVALARQHMPLDFLVCDEVQFYSVEQCDELATIVDDFGIDVYSFGLITDFRGLLFDGTKRMLEIADQRTEMQVEARCWCGARARTTHDS